MLCQHKLHMKAITSHYSVIQRCQVHQIFVFYLLHCKLKEKDHIRSKKVFLFAISITIILICGKLESTGPVQKKIKLLLPYLVSLNA